MTEENNNTSFSGYSGIEEVEIKLQKLSAMLDMVRLHVAEYDVIKENVFLNYLEVMAELMSGTIKELKHG